MHAEAHDLRVRIGEPARGAVLAATRDSVTAMVERTWKELGLAAQPRVSVEAGPASRVVDVSLGEGSLALSARAAQQVIVAGTGTLWRRDEPRGHAEWMRGRLDEAGDDGRPALVEGLVHATLIAGIPALLAADAPRLAHDITTAAEDSEAVAGATAVLTRAGELGLAPSQLDLTLVAELAEFAGSGGEDAVDDACEHLLRTWDASYRIAPTLEASRATLRRLTTGDSPLHASLLTGKGVERLPGRPRAESANLYAEFGVTVPMPSLRIADDLRDDRIRVRFGAVATAEHLVLPDGHVAIERLPGVAQDPTEVLSYRDPVFGRAWSVATERGDGSSPSRAARRYSPAALVLRSVRAEFQRRLAWWAPESSTEIDGEYVTGALADDLRRRLPLVRRRLLADGAAARDSATIVEALIRGMVEEETSIGSGTRRVRAALGGAVLGAVPANAPVSVHEPDDDMVAAACADGGVAALLHDEPWLASSTGMNVLLCNADRREGVQRLVRSLGDVVVVATRQEIEGTVLEIEDAPDRQP